MIAQGDYKTNDKLPTELELAKQFGVSRSSVREALKTLNYLGILESHTSKGTWLTENNRIAEESTAWSLLLGYEKIRDVFVLGTALDTQVAIIIMNYFKKGKGNRNTLINSIDMIIKNMYEASRDKDMARYKKEFSEYFRKLYAASNNSVFVSLNECIDSLIVSKVCDAYNQTDNLTNATKYLETIWTCINTCDINQGIDAVQEYGLFAYNVFLAVEIMDSDGQLHE
jgi:GntR family transcriptional repressor for pyruvate dehydrogenase complex